MSIIYHSDWDMSRKGEKDAQRHRDLIDKSIRKNVKDVISEESIITKRKGRKVRIPIKGLKDFRFIHGQSGTKGGVGQGEGDEGDSIGQRKNGKGKGNKPGEEIGEDYMETEVDIDYLIKIMFEDLGLPWIEEKTKAKQLVPKGWKFDTVSKKGIIPRIHKKRTMIEAIKRTSAFIGEIMNDTGCSFEEGRLALLQANGDIEDAITIIKEGKLTETSDGIYIEDDDLRFKQIEEDYELHSNAVVIAIMDVSGSMDTDKKYLARSMLFWMVEFLRKKYDNVEIRFIVHTTEARLVSEDDFFNRGENGGTKCASGFKLANEIIEAEYPSTEWNVYVQYLSDGDDWGPEDTIKEIKIMLDKKINMLGYTEIKPDTSYGASLIKKIKDTWKFTVRSVDGTSFYKNEDLRFLLARITNRSHIWEALKHFLFENDKR